MTKQWVLGILLTFGSVAMAQTAPDVAPPQGGPGARAGHITATGETVPNPGVSQSGGTTPLDRGIQARDNAIDSSICRGC